MNRERDSEVVHELVTSKYKIAASNRLAKYRFLSNENVTTLTSKHHGSEPSLAQTEKANVKPVDLSVPGTPVSSRYLESLGAFRRNQGEIETESEDEDEFKSLLKAGLKQFTSDMEKLQSDIKSHDKVDAVPLVKKEQPALSRIEKYFQESARRGSLTREFTEVVQDFDPRITRDYDSMSKPGTPVSSKMRAEKISSKKLQPFTDNMKKLEAIKIATNPEKNGKSPPEKPKRMNPVPLTPLADIPATPIVTPPTPDLQKKNAIDKESQFLIIVETKLIVDEITEDESGQSASEQEQISDNMSAKETSTILAEIQQTSENYNSILENSSEPVLVQENSTRPVRKISIPGTPIDSSKLSDNSDLGSDIEVIESAEIEEAARELVDEIENLVQIAFEDENKETEKEETVCKIQTYFNESDNDKSFQRTFSEIVSFNQPSMDVKEKVEKFFKESDEKKSLTRGFSEAVNYVEQINIEDLFKPGTPVSSKTIESLQIIDEIDSAREIDPVMRQGIDAFKKAHEALHTPAEFNIEKYFEESATRHTLKRDFSEVVGVIGETPKSENPEVRKFFEQSDEKMSFHRQFSDAVQTLPPRINDILKDEKTSTVPKQTSRLSVFSAPEITPDSPSVSRNHGKKYGIDKYFATSLYRTAYHRSKDQRRGSEPDHRFAILEDEYVFGENDVLRAQVFQDDDSTPLHLKKKKNNKGDESDEELDQQNVKFWRGFLKPYTLNLQSDIVMRDELIDKYTKYTLE